MCHLVQVGFLGGVRTAYMGKLCFEHGYLCFKLSNFCVILVNLFVGFL